MKIICWISFFLGMGAALAEPETPGDRERKMPKPRPDKGQEGRGFADFLKRADGNGDGKVSRDEFMALERLTKLTGDQRTTMFGRLDKNGDGFITAEEMRFANRPPKGGRGVPQLGDLDKDGDRSVSFEEFLESPFVQRLPEERRRPFFDRLDTNRDGKLSPEDRRRGGAGKGPGGDRPDRERPDGQRPWGDRPGEPKPDLQARFDELDRNGDGSLDFEEFRTLPGIRDRGEDFQEDRFEELDNNGDLKIQKNELKPGPKPDRARPERDAQRGGPMRDGERPGPRQPPADPGAE